MSSSTLGKLEADIEIKAPADRFLEMATQRMYRLSNISPDKIASCELFEGDWGKEGSVISWNYLIDGNASVGKELFEAIDFEKNSVTWKVIEGDILQYYKSFKSSFQATPKAKGDEEGTCVHWTLEYEKLHDKVPDPHAKLQLIVGIVKDIDAYLTTQA
ncbi:hypothetical protein M0R45_002179 [Rubus argutus]|uniref:Bet v I/Major latex protein domain-containing protein n=1 Tax=Rubus argutus TaxID=59490 RepID=A0AAW1VN93_RUBAR